MTQHKFGDGGCQCGKVRYRLSREPQTLYACHCSDCQKQSGRAFGTRIMHDSDETGQNVSIKAGSLDDTRESRPNAHIWLQSAQPWVSVDRSKYACFDTEPADRALNGKPATREPADG